MRIDRKYKMIATPEQSEKIQHICFDQGIFWETPDNTKGDEIQPGLEYLVVGNWLKGRRSLANYLDTTDATEITAEEFIAKFGDEEVDTKEAKSTDAYTRIIEWVYVNDGKFGSREGWRKAFVNFLKEVLL